MSRFHSYLSSALQIINSYDGKAPLVFKLKHFFSADKKFGSRDRRTIASMCYSYYRTGHAFDQENKKEKLAKSLFLCEPDLFLQLPDMDGKWVQYVNEPLENRIKFADLNPEKLFPFRDQISEEIDKDAFIYSFLQQPDLFLRIRPGKKNKVIKILKEKEVYYKEESFDCIRLNNSFNASSVLKINRDVVVQDFNSQQVLDRVAENIENVEVPDVWDCCAASGGKSILLYDRLNGKVRLTVSDIRQSILANLEKRLKDAGVNIMKCFVANLRERVVPEQEQFHVILCDVPCSGSGTWGRTPEQLYFFDKTKIEEYAILQKQITLNALANLKTGGLLIYITCSVFKEENEKVAEMLLDQTKLQLVHMKYLEGYSRKADTMFVAMFRLP